MNKENVVCIYISIYIYNEILLSHKKEDNLAICNMDGPLGHNVK